MKCEKVRRIYKKVCAVLLFKLKGISVGILLSTVSLLWDSGYTNFVVTTSERFRGLNSSFQSYFMSRGGERLIAKPL